MLNPQSKPQGAAALASRPRALLAWIVLWSVGLALVTRELLDVRVTRLSEGDPSQGWYSYDPDSLYHVRRVDRALMESMLPAATDPRLNFPHGAPIPWPPYYDLALAVALAPWSANLERAQRQAFVERSVCSVPWGMASLNAGQLACLGWMVAGPLGALVAGTTYACLGASIYYSAPGIGDHHAFIVLLETTLFLMASLALARENSRKRALGLGVAAGAVLGIALGAWAGALLFAGALQIALLLALFVRAERRDLAHFSAALHVVAALVLLPAVLASPWRHSEPWMVVNLSWFHVAYLFAGALALLPRCLLASESVWYKRWPLVICAVALASAMLVKWSPDALSSSVRSGFAWAARGNDFMAYVQESQPLLADGLTWPLRDLGYAVLLFPVALVWVAVSALRQRDLVRVLWTTLGLVLFTQALLQRRFGDAFGPAMAVVLAVCLADLLGWERHAWPKRGLLLGATALGALGLHVPTLRDAVQRVSYEEPFVRGKQSQAWRGQRELVEWLGRQNPDQSWCVLAPWDLGHTIEWAGDSPTVATNFGSYLGEASYLDPGRFFLEESTLDAEQLLLERRARFVLVPANFSDSMEVLMRILRPGLRGLYLSGARPASYTPRWYRTMVARAMHDGHVDSSRGAPAEAQLDFLRLVHVSARAYPLKVAIPHVPETAALPCGWIWERVEGARVQARCAPEQELRVELSVQYPSMPHPLVWTGAARPNAAGIASVRVPYSSETNGDGVAQGPARYVVGSRSGEIVLSELDVTQGRTRSID